MKLTTFATFVTLITFATALSNDDNARVYPADPKIKQGVLKGRQLNPHNSIIKRMVNTAVSTDAYQQMSNPFSQFSSPIQPPTSYNSFNSPSISPPRAMIRCIRYPCPNVPAPTRANSPPRPPRSRPSRHHYPPPRASRKKEIYRDTSETEEQTTEQEEATSGREEEPENREKQEGEENEVSKPEKEENENEKNENEKPEKAEKEETENRPGPGEEP